MRIRIPNGKLTDVSVYLAKPVKGMRIHGRRSRQSAIWTHESVDVELPQTIEAECDASDEDDYADIIFENGTVLGYVAKSQFRLLKRK